MERSKKKCQHIWRFGNVVKEDIMRNVNSPSALSADYQKVGEEVVAILYCEKCGELKGSLVKVK